MNGHSYQDCQDDDGTHRTCGTTTEGYASALLNGKRCALCTPIIPKEDMRGYVTECTGGEYRVSSIERNTITVCGPDGKELTNSVQFFIQELSLGEKSSVFNHVVKKPEIPLRDAAVLYFKAKEVCGKYGVWIPEETDAAMEFAKIQYLSRQLLAEGHLFRKCPGVFSVDLDVPMRLQSGRFTWSVAGNISGLITMNPPRTMPVFWIRNRKRNTFCVMT